MAFNEEELKKKWMEIFEDKSVSTEISLLKEKYPEKRSIVFSFKIIEKISPEFSIELLSTPEDLLTKGKELLVKEHFANKDVSINMINLRITDIPDDYKVRIRDIRAIHLNKLISIEGLVRKVSDVRPRLLDGVFRCKSCGAHILEPQDGLTIKFPRECYTDQGGCGAQGNGKFVLEPKLSRFIDFQRIEVEETGDAIDASTQPQSLEIHLQDDITGHIVPGLRVIVSGILKTNSYEGKSTRSYFDIYMEAISVGKEKKEYEEIELTTEDIEQIKEASKDPLIVDKFVKSISPSIAEMDKIKEAIALQLFGGVPKQLRDGTRIKGDIHILLVGDPGTAKSQLLRYVASIAPRGIYTSGKSASAAGLTAAAVRDELGDGRWTLEAGLLVLANKGIACIDELDKMSNEDRSSMHEALEQQTISIAKAGITATLPTQCAVLAAANPKWGRFDTSDVEESLLSQIDLPQTLLSRFDAIFPLTDQPDEERDTRIATHILETHRSGELDVSQKNRLDSEEIQFEGNKPYFTPSFLKKYIAYAKNNIFPVLLPETMEHIKKYYISKRNTGSSSSGEGGRPIAITARQLEACIRMSEASAKLRLSSTVDLEDAERAISIEEYFLQRTVANAKGTIDIDQFSTGISAKKRMDMKSGEKFIRSYFDEHKEYPTEEELLKYVEDKGLDKNSFVRILETLHKQGLVFMKKDGDKKRIVITDEGAY